MHPYSIPERKPPPMRTPLQSPRCALFSRPVFSCAQDVPVYGVFFPAWCYGWPIRLTFFSACLQDAGGRDTEGFKDDVRQIFQKYEMS